MDVAVMSVASVAVASIGAVIYLSIKLHEQTTKSARLQIIEVQLHGEVVRLRADLRIQEIRANESARNESVAINQAFELVDRMPHGDRRNIMLKQFERRAARASDANKTGALPASASTGAIERASVDPLVRRIETVRGPDVGAGGGDVGSLGQNGNLDRGVGPVRQ
jgi:hypothetical protein